MCPFDNYLRGQKENVSDALALHYMYLGKDFYFKSSHISKILGIRPEVIGRVLKKYVSDDIVEPVNNSKRKITWKTNFGVDKK